jgi:hypothetical protein
MFIYPFLSTRIVQAFVCREVDGKTYLRCVYLLFLHTSIILPHIIQHATFPLPAHSADYTLECGTSEWWTAAVYASVWIVVFVFGLPFGTFYYLYSRREELNTTKMLKSTGFIYRDYKPKYYW